MNKKTSAERHRRKFTNDSSWTQLFSNENWIKSKNYVINETGICIGF